MYRATFDDLGLSAPDWTPAFGDPQMPQIRLHFECQRVDLQGGGKSDFDLGVRERFLVGGAPIWDAILG